MRSVRVEPPFKPGAGSVETHLRKAELNQTLANGLRQAQPERGVNRCFPNLLNSDAGEIPPMNTQRRTLVSAASLAAALASIGALTPGQAAAQARRNTAAFGAKSLQEAISAVAGNVIESKDIVLSLQDINEDGAKVPVSVTSKIPNTQEIHVFVDKNLNPLSASFVFTQGTEPFVNTNIKMAQSAQVVAVVKAQGKFYFASKETRITLGGCSV
jgi:sulfur-oxidizing protein SoxY